MTKITKLELIAYDLLARDDIFDLHSTRDAAELADHLINISTLPDTITNADADDLHAMMVGMIFDAHE
jgi:hypothetical protein